MPLFRKRQAGSGGGIPAVTLVHPDGTSDVFNPAADSDVSRGSALSLALAAFTAGDLIVLGVGAFNIPLTNVNALQVRGQGPTTIVRGTVTSGIRLNAGNSTLANFVIEGGLPMNGGSLKASSMVIQGLAGAGAIVRTGAAGSAELGNTYLHAGAGAANSIESGGSAFTVKTVNSAANADPDANVVLSSPEGFSVSANYP